MTVIAKQCGLRVIFLTLAAAMTASLVAAVERIGSDVGGRVAAATVMVRIEFDDPSDPRTSWGTGFVVGDGLIMTNAHVVNDEAPKRIYVSNLHLPATEAGILAIRYDSDGGGRPGSTYYDIALLAYAPPPGGKLPALAFSLNAAPNQSVFAFGYPGPDRRRPVASSPGAGSQTALAVTDGVIHQIIVADPYLLMHTALCRNGNSGGPLVNSRGEVVGMQTWSADPDVRTNVIESFAIGSRGLAGFMHWAGFQPFVVR